MVTSPVVFVRFSPVSSCSPEVADESRAEVAVEGRRPTRPLQVVARARGFDPDDPCFALSPGTSKVTGTDGPIEVSTLEHVMGHLQTRIAGGTDGAGFGLYSRIDVSSLQPFVRFFLSPISPLEEGSPRAPLFAICLFLGEVSPSTRKVSGVPCTSGRWELAAVCAASRRVVLRSRLRVTMPRAWDCPQSSNVASECKAVTVSSTRSLTGLYTLPRQCRHPIRDAPDGC